MQWEYQIVSLDGGGYLSDANGPTEAGLNELGAEGCELASSLVGTSIKLGGRVGSTTALVCKRPIGHDESGEPSTDTAGGSGQ